MLNLREWKDALAVNSIYLLLLHLLQAVHNYLYFHSRISDTLIWPPWVPQMAAKPLQIHPCCLQSSIQLVAEALLAETLERKGFFDGLKCDRKNSPKEIHGFSPATQCLALGSGVWTHTALLQIQVSWNYEDSWLLFAVMRISWQLILQTVLFTTPFL